VHVERACLRSTDKVERSARRDLIRHGATFPLAINQLPSASPGAVFCNLAAPSSVFQIVALYAIFRLLAGVIRRKSRKREPFRSLWPCASPFCSRQRTFKFVELAIAFFLGPWAGDRKLPAGDRPAATRPKSTGDMLPLISSPFTASRGDGRCQDAAASHTDRNRVVGQGHNRAFRFMYHRLWQLLLIP
jgi:hypothetical protein